MAILLVLFILPGPHFFFLDMIHRIEKDSSHTACPAQSGGSLTKREDPPKGKEWESTTDEDNQHGYGKLSTFAR